MGSSVILNMRRKWFWVAASVLTLAGVALAGCAQQGGLEPVYPTVRPTQTDQRDEVATAAPLQQAAPATTSTLESAQSPEASPAATEIIPSLTPGAPAGLMDNQQASKEAVEKAKADLAKRFGIPGNEIVVVVTVDQEFTTDGFYCRVTKDRVPRDESPAVISGISILLNASGRRYEYHASGQTVVFCRSLP